MTFAGISSVPILIVFPVESVKFTMQERNIEKSIKSSVSGLSMLTSKSQTYTVPADDVVSEGRKVK